MIEMSASSTLAASELHHGSPQTRPSLAAELLAEVREGLACREASVMPWRIGSPRKLPATAKVQLAADVVTVAKVQLAAEVATTVKVQLAAEVQLVADGREASARRRSSEFAAEVPLYAELHDLSSRHRDFVP